MQAPNFSLEHIDGPTMSLSEFAGRPTVLIFAGKPTGGQAQQISQAVAGALQDRVNIISVLYLEDVPKLARPIAKRELRKAYEEAVRSAAAHRQATGMPLGDPTRVVVMLMDWDGAVTKSFGIGDPNAAAVAVVLGADGAIQGQVSGDGAGQQIVSHFSGA